MRDSMNETVNMTAEGHRDYTGAKIGMWLFLTTELFLFMGPFMLYAVYRYRYTLDFHNASSGLNLALGTVNTVILLTSSLTMALSVSTIKKGNKRLSVLFLMMTILFGAVFLVNKYVEWGTEIGHGIYPNSAVLLGHSRGEILFYGLYFFATGMHGLHVFAGIILLSVMAVMAGKGKIDQSDFIKIENSGLYWHLVDIVWIYLFPLFYLIV